MMYAVVTTEEVFHEQHGEFVAAVKDILQLFKTEQDAIDAAAIYGAFHDYQVAVVFAASDLLPGMIL